MSNIEGLKEQARRHEQKEEWRKALELYNRAIDRLAEEDTPDIGLYNRVGDLFIRVGEVDQAVGAFEKAVDLYVDAELPNNAIAVCKKILRNVPDRAEVFLRMGRVRAAQGFVVDARSHFITYAERTLAAGDLDEAMRALVEFADAAEDDTGIRLAIATHFQQHERTDEAVEQLIEGYRSAVRQGLDEEVTTFEGRLAELRPGADPAVLAEAVDAGEPEVEEQAFAIESTSLAGDPVDPYPSAEAAVSEAMEDRAGEGEAADESFDDGDASDGWHFGDRQTLDDAHATEPGPVEPEMAVEPGFDPEPAAAEAPAAEAISTGLHDHQPFDVFSDTEETPDSLDDAILSIGPDVSGFEPPADEANPLEGFDLVAEEGEIDEAVDEFYDDGDDDVDLPLTLYHDDAEDDDEEPVELPFLHHPESEADEPEPFAEPTVPFDEEVAVDPPELSESVEPPESRDSDLLASRIAEAPDDLDLRQRAVELAHRSGDEGALAAAYVGLGEALRRSGAEVRAQAVFRQALQLDPDHAEARAALDGAEEASRPVAEVASNEDYVDLGALILGDEDEKTTRFVVAYEEPSGDEQADFAKMLTQFKAKVAENVDADDVKAHHDLGTAYKEMGLLDEAVEEFQAALRASSDHLPTYEMLGQTFLDRGTPQAAVRVLTRALDVPFEVEDELLGIYYSLGRSHEVLGNTEQAREFYERVFSLDINFADVTERLRALR
ncbi:tetratricopeptide repeat protein [Gaopeijia maritima]|uniref:Tetratricopeptide repeat protein n=1 Tax=Gaopeijia maritima TaxID=3119007 RepID=A0ABU9EBS2_9BACT